MALLRTIWRIAYCIVAPILILAFAVTLLSLHVDYGYTTSATTSGQSMTFVATGVINFLSPLLRGSNFTLTETVNGEIENATYDLVNGVQFTFKTVDTKSEFTNFTFSYETIALIGALLVLVGSFFLLSGYGSKIVTLIGAVFTIAGSIFLFSQQGCFDPFGIVIANTDETKEALANVSVPWLSTGIILILQDILGLADAFFVLTKKKAAA